MSRHGSRITRGALALGATLLLTGPLAAQHRPSPQGITALAPPSGPMRLSLPAAPVSRRADEDRTGLAMLAGTVGGAVGFYALGHVGAALLQESTGFCYEDCGLLGFFWGAAIGEGLGFGLASHLTNPRHSTLRALLVPTAISTAGAGLGLGLGSAWPIYPVIPLQLLSLSF